jgi:hypothetical protein
MNVLSCFGNHGMMYIMPKNGTIGVDVKKVELYLLDLPNS